jgi:hypothetical protein
MEGTLSCQCGGQPDFMNWISDTFGINERGAVAQFENPQTLLTNE